jgi:hypothetical protein
MHVIEGALVSEGDRWRWGVIEGAAGGVGREGRLRWRYR